VVIVVSEKIWTDQLATLRGGVVSTLFYVTNWWLIADHQSYFVASGRPSMLQHLWSLAIEEQYYLIWTLVVMGVAGLLFGRRMFTDPARGTRRLILVAIGCAIASTLLMAAFAIHDDLPYRGSTSRVYFGSDTHSTGLFLGSAAGAWLALRHRTGRPSVRPRRGTLLGAGDVLGALALVVVVYVQFQVDEFRPGLYRGGFLAFDALVLLVIACAVRPRGLLGRVLDIRPLRWIGKRAYAIYIWHWPVVLVTRPDVDVHGPVVLLDAARLTLILGLGALSYRYVEEPLRRGGYRQWRREQVRRTPWWRSETTIALGTSTLATAFLIAAGGPPAASTPTASIPAPTTTASAPASAPARRSAAAHAPAPRASASHPPPTTARHKPAPVAEPALSAFGDSVLVGAETDLKARTSRLQFDAVEGRQAYNVLDDVADRAAAHRLRPNVLIHIGNNGIISAGQLRHTLAELADRRRVLLFTDRVPRDWEDPNNRIIRSMRGEYRNVVVVDWQALSTGHGNWFYSDGLHLTPVGAAAYSTIAVQALRST
jgi:peptidoglycan/LPS O-acetylase OafA/YrhL